MRILATATRDTSEPCSFRGRERASSSVWTEAGVSAAVLVCVFLLGTGVRMWNLTYQSLWFDEGYTVVLAQSATWHQFWVRFGNYTTSEHLQPLYYVLIFLWTRVAGTSDFALRFPSAIFSAGSVVALWFALRGQASAWLANVACAGLAVSSFSLYYAQEARPYAMLQLLSFTLFAVWMTQQRRGRGESEARSDVWLGVVCALCLLASPFTTLLAACLAMIDLMTTRDAARSRWEQWWSRWGFAALLSGLVAVIYGMIALRTFPRIVAKDITVLRQPLWMNIAYAVRGVAFGTTLPPSADQLRGPSKLPALLANSPVIAACSLVLLLLGLGTVRLMRTSQPGAPVRTLAVLSAVYAAALFGIFGIVGKLNVLPRHASALFALLFLTAALAVARVRKAPYGAGAWALRIGICGWVLLNFWSVANYWRNPVFAKDDYRGLAHRLLEQPMRTVIASGQPLLLARYGYADAVDADEASGPRLLRILASESGGIEPVRIVMNRYRSARWRQDDELPRFLSSDYACAEQYVLQAFDVYVCAPRPSAIRSVWLRQHSSNPGER
ncbi:MAG: glycosyltransferase family 39 protein [Acidobacteriaceae bacterium]